MADLRLVERDNKKLNKDNEENLEFESIDIRLASPEQILKWSHGEVKKPETINYRTLKPEKDGLFCERIFGPAKDYECHCGKYKKIRYRGIVCDKCGVEVTKSKVRRERMGHIKLAAPVSHIWYFRGIPSRMALILDLSPRQLERVLYFANYIVLDPGKTGLKLKQIISEADYQETVRKFGRDAFRAGMGAESIQELLAQIDVDKETEDLRNDIKASKGQKRVRLVKRLEVMEAFSRSENKPEHMVLDVLPVLPPELRPMVQLDGGRFATSDLNDLYRRVINRNNRLNKLLQLGAPEIIIRNEKRMLQESVDSLIDNGRRGRAVAGAGNRALKSLSELLKGKQGRFRQNLLGKRVDYSGRSVIVIGPELKMHQCGLPTEMAIELFKPFVMSRLMDEGYAHNIKTAKTLVERGDDAVWDILAEVIQDHPVMLNRAPTLHRLGIQAFEPVLVQGKAIKLHPLACTAFNADFDGDQMAVHVPLSAEAKAECRFLMLHSTNLLKPQDGKPVTVPTQDMVLGLYYLTIDKENCKGDGKVFTSLDEAEMAYDKGDIELHSTITVRFDGGKKFGKNIYHRVTSTYGRFLFNQIIPQNLGYVDRTVAENEFDLEVDEVVDKTKLGNIIERLICYNGLTKTASILDDIKKLGYHFATKSGISISVFDMEVPGVKQEYLQKAEEKVEFINKQHQRGLLNEDGRSQATIQVWTKTTDDITEALKVNMDRYNSIAMMSQSGARGSMSQIKQLAGMRGNVSDTSGKTIEIPIKSNLREGMNILEFFISSHGARKALSDTALKTADSGYLTRRLVDVAQDIIITQVDCGSEDSVTMTALTSGSGASKRVISTLADRIVGRYAAEDIIDPETGEVICNAGKLITNKKAEKVELTEIEAVKIRSVLTCEAKHGVCAKCYGTNLATGSKAEIGESVGIMAAQSIGEPGTQLTMRTFHTGGIALSGEDITQGLPRVEELFEARKPKGQAIMSQTAGIVSIKDSSKRKTEVEVTDAEGKVKKYNVPYGSTLLIEEGDSIEAGDLITEGSINPHDIMKVSGVAGVARYITSEVIKVYNNNGIDINDKHVEIICRQMMRKVRVNEAGDTELPTGGVVDIFNFREENTRVNNEGGEIAEGERLLLGITKASLATESWLSAASFQETTRVLTDVAVKGKRDELIGLKENVIIGTLIPAGTGLAYYRNLTPVPVIEENKEILENVLENAEELEDTDSEKVIN